MQARAATIMHEPEAPPRGLVFFSSATPAAARRRRLVFVAVLLLAAAAVGWPLYPFFAGARPFVLGLPLSLAWVVLWLFVVFVALAWLYRGEPPGDES